MLCVKECPDWCIHIESHNEEVSEPGARRPRSVAVLDSFAIDWGLCMYCGICIEVCPFDAITMWTRIGELSSDARSGLVFDLKALTAERFYPSPMTPERPPAPAPAPAPAAKGQVVTIGLQNASTAQTLQTTMRPDLVVDQLLRIGRRAFVSFPNFAQWRIRLALMFGGTMPVTKQLPDRWYDTPNIHHVTIDDFRNYITARGIRIEGQWFLRGEKLISAGIANLRAEHAVFLLAR